MRILPDDFPSNQRRALPRVVILNDSSVAKGGATGLAILSAKMLRARGHEVTFVSGDAGDDGTLAELGIQLVAMGGKLLLDDTRLNAMRNGVYNTRIRDRLARDIKAHDTEDTIYHLHGWSRVLSPSVFDALKPVAKRTFIHAHDFFLACPNGVYFDYRRKAPCTRTPLSAGCLATNCDKRAFHHKVWRSMRHGALKRTFDTRLPWAGVMMLHAGMTEGLERAGIPKSLLRVVRNPATPLSQTRIKAEQNQRICYVGRLEVGKGVATLCAAAQAAGVGLRVIGDGTARAKLAEAYPDVEFTGWVDHTDIASRLRDVRALVMPSRFPEPFGLVAAEASLSGLPVIMSDLSLLAHDLTQKNLGFLADTSSSAALADAIAKFNALPDSEIRAISERGFARQDALAQEPDTWIAELVGHYENAIA